MSDTLSERRLRRPRLSDTSTDSAPLSVDAASAAVTADAPSPAAATPSAAGEAWRPIDDKARSGVPVFVRGAEGERAEAYYVHTRQRVGVKWEPVGLWRDRNSMGSRLRFEPVEYQEVGFVPLFQGSTS